MSSSQGKGSVSEKFHLKPAALLRKPQTHPSKEKKLGQISRLEHVRRQCCFLRVERGPVWALKGRYPKTMCFLLQAIHLEFPRFLQNSGKMVPCCGPAAPSQPTNEANVEREQRRKRKGKGQKNKNRGRQKLELPNTKKGQSQDASAASSRYNKYVQT